ncbi:MAG TPA: tyrosine-type recombinase/integrase, partial [Terriglobales bacterium]|nr:tyrosine-type recombinase/integrase [Terriglobales bacterium]
EVLTAPRSPWQSPYVERLIGLIRRECLDHMLVFNRPSLRRTVACLGLRISELLGLQWADIDFENRAVRIQRSVVEGEINETKTEASQRMLPLDPDLAELLMSHRFNSSFKTDPDYVFAGPSGQPPWPDSILADHLKPAAVEAGIAKSADTPLGTLRVHAKLTSQIRRDGVVPMR